MSHLDATRSALNEATAAFKQASDELSDAFDREAEAEWLVRLARKRKNAAHDALHAAWSVDHKARGAFHTAQTGDNN